MDFDYFSNSIYLDPLRYQIMVTINKTFSSILRWCKMSFFGEKLKLSNSRPMPDKRITSDLSVLDTMVSVVIRTSPGCITDIIWASEWPSVQFKHQCLLWDSWKTDNAFSSTGRKFLKWATVTMLALNIYVRRYKITAKNYLQ